MIWLRHEVWEYADGYAYRLASKAETERLAQEHPEGVLKYVFYAPTPAAAEAQYHALRHLGPFIPTSDEANARYGKAELESQLAEFPDDETLARQPAVTEPEPDPVDAHDAAHAEEPHAEPVHATEDHPVEHAAASATPTEHHAPEAHDEGAHGHVQETDHAVMEAAAPFPDHHAPVEPLAWTPPAQHPAAPAAVTLEPEADPSLDLGNRFGAAPAPRWARRRKPNAFLGFLRFLLLLIILGVVVIGIGVATGNMDGPTLIAMAKDLPARIQALPVVRDLMH